MIVYQSKVNIICNEKFVEEDKEDCAIEVMKWGQARAMIPMDELLRVVKNNEQGTTRKDFQLSKKIVLFVSG